MAHRAAYDGPTPCGLAPVGAGSAQHTRSSVPHVHLDSEVVPAVVRWALTARQAGGPESRGHVSHGDRCRSRRRPSAVGSGARGAAVALDRRDDGGDELQENKQIPAPALCRALRTEVSARTGFDAVSDGSFRRCCMRRMLRAACCNDVFRMWHSACCISNGAFHFPCCISHVVRFMLHLVGCALCVARCTHWSTRNVASEYAMSHMRFMTCSTARRRPAVSVGPGVPHGVAATGHNQITFRGCAQPRCR